MGALALLMVSFASTPVAASTQSDCQQMVLDESGVNAKEAAAVKSGAPLKYRGHTFRLAPGRTIWNACGYLPGFWENAVNGVRRATSPDSSAAETIARLQNELKAAQKKLEDARKEVQHWQRLNLWLLCTILAIAIFLLVDQVGAYLLPKKGPNERISTFRRANA